MSHTETVGDGAETAVDGPQASAGTPDATSRPANGAPGADAAADALVEADLLVEDVSIDGMCGVY